jgi:CRISPR-associated protein Cas2
MVMQTLVIYDIPDDKIRNKISEACKDYGLTRIQYSAFLGDINYNRRDELRQRLRRTLGKKEGNIQIYPLCDKDIKLKCEIVNTGEKK